MKKRFKRAISLTVFFVFLFQVVTLSGQVIDSKKISDETKKAMNNIAGQVESMNLVCETLGSKSYVEYLQKSLVKKRETIVNSIMEQVQNEGIEKVQNDLEKFGPVGKSLAEDLKMCKTKPQKLEMLKLNLNHQLGVLSKKLGKMNNQQISEELNDMRNRLNFKSSSNNIESTNGNLIEFNFINVNKKGNTEGFVGGFFKFSWAIMKAGVAIFIFALNSLVFVTKGIVSLTVLMLNIGVGALKLTVGAIIGILRIIF